MPLGAGTELVQLVVQSVDPRVASTSDLVGHSGFYWKAGQMRQVPARCECPVRACMASFFGVERRTETIDVASSYARRQRSMLPQQAAKICFAGRPSDPTLQMVAPHRAVWQASHYCVEACFAEAQGFEPSSLQGAVGFPGERLAARARRSIATLPVGRHAHSAAEVSAAASC